MFQRTQPGYLSISSGVEAELNPSAIDMCSNRNQGRVGTAWHHRAMQMDFISESVFGRIALPEVIGKLAGSGALFALVHGSHVTGSRQVNLDPDLADYCGGEIPLSCDACCRPVATCRC